MRATANRDFTFWSFNCVSKRGKRLRKNRQAKNGQEYEVVRFFTGSQGLFATGAKCVAVRGDNESLYGEFVSNFGYDYPMQSCPPQVRPLSCPLKWSCPIARAELAKELEGWLPPNALKALKEPIA